MGSGGGSLALPAETVRAWCHLLVLLLPEEVLGKAPEALRPPAPAPRGGYASGPAGVVVPETGQ